MKVNDNIYATKETINNIGFTDTLYSIVDSKKMSFNTPQWDRSILPWGYNHSIDMKYYVSTGSKIIEAGTGEANNFILCKNEGLGTYTNSVKFYKNIDKNTEINGNIAYAWSPDQKLNNVYKVSLVNNFSYMDIILCVWCVCVVNGAINYQVSLNDYLNSTYKLLAIYCTALNKGNRNKYDGNNLWINHVYNTSLNFRLDAINKNVNVSNIGAPIAGDNSIIVVGAKQTFVMNTGQSWNGKMHMSVLSPIYNSKYISNITDTTATSDPEAKEHNITWDVNISKDEILSEVANLGFPFYTNGYVNFLDLNDENLYIPVIKSGLSTGTYTNGSNNANNPQINWSNPWTDAKYDPYKPIDPNKYTDKIDLNAPGLTTTGIFNRTFALTANSIKSLADYLWNADETIFNEIVKGLSLMGGNPIDGLIDLRLYPFDVSAKTSGGNSKSIVVGRTDTKVNGLEINDYNAVLDLGSCTFFPNFGNFLDYEPFTTASLYIPYVGIVPISTADFMGQTISCKMVVDITTGSCTAIVFANDIPIIYKNGYIGVEIPMTGTNSAEYASRIAGGLTSGATDVALGATSKSVGQVVSGVGSIVDSALSVNNTMYNTAGSSSPACGLWQPQNCYFIIQRPVPIVPENYGHTVGYACNYQAKISECSGYTQTYNVDVSSINAPESEKNAIAEILNSGFYA